VRCGIEVVPFGAYAEPGPVVELAVAAEAAGWDALCIWDHCHFWGGVCDPWVALTAVAAATSRLRLITDVSPLPRYRPHMLARSLHALDAFSGGRVTFGAGLGVAEDLAPLGDDRDDRTRAAMTDEALDLVVRWCNAETITHEGVHYRADGAQVANRPTQTPRIPVWIGGWSRPALRRAARWDGWVVSAIDENQVVQFGPDRIADAVTYLREHGASEGFDVAVNGTTPVGERGLVPEYAEAGATWWFESVFGLRGPHTEMLERVAAGPPR
jgi:alkanesulfonate monooxygenase SsuD/methylene tetrahydromethanopterin reductase-like flavin-dependent oxidoreductase (luciferase family)